MHLKHYVGCRIHLHRMLHGQTCSGSLISAVYPGRPTSPVAKHRYFLDTIRPANCARNHHDLSPSFEHLYRGPPLAAVSLEAKCLFCVMSSVYSLIGLPVWCTDQTLELPNTPKQLGNGSSSGTISVVQWVATSSPCCEIVTGE